MRNIEHLPEIAEFDGAKFMNSVPHVSRNKPVFTLHDFWGWDWGMSPLSKVWSRDCKAEAIRRRPKGFLNLSAFFSPLACPLRLLFFLQLGGVGLGRNSILLRPYEMLQPVYPTCSGHLFLVVSIVKQVLIIIATAKAIKRLVVIMPIFSGLVYG